MVAVSAASSSAAAAATAATGTWSALWPVLVLMPASQLASYWILLWSTPSTGVTPRDHLFRGLAAVSAFYAGWALYKRIFQGDQNDLGHITMGFLCVMSLLKRPKLAAVGTVIVLLHYGLALYLVFVKLSSAKALAQAVKKSTSTAALVWAWTLRGYMVSNAVLWYHVLVTKVLPLLVHGYDAVPPSS